MDVQFLTHKDGIPWDEAPLPRRWHRCWRQTRWFSHGEVWGRCPCGATYAGTGWCQKNETRKGWRSRDERACGLRQRRN